MRSVPSSRSVPAEQSPYTGAGPSESIRSRLVDFGDESVVIRERKKSKKQHPIRRVPLSPLRKQILKEWFAAHPGGPYAFCICKGIAIPQKGRTAGGFGSRS